MTNRTDMSCILTENERSYRKSEPKAGSSTKICEFQEHRLTKRISESTPTGKMAVKLTILIPRSRGTQLKIKTDAVTLLRSINAYTRRAENAGDDSVV